MRAHREKLAETHPDMAWTDEHERLYNEAMSRFKARCLWNANPSRSVRGMEIIADRLRSHGGMDAWNLAEEIRKAIGRAA